MCCAFLNYYYLMEFNLINFPKNQLGFIDLFANGKYWYEHLRPRWWVRGGAYVLKQCLKVSIFKLPHGLSQDL